MARVRQAFGGLLAISFGSLTEIILAILMLAHEQATVGAGAEYRLHYRHGFAWPGCCHCSRRQGRERQTFKRERTGLLSSLVILAVIALLLPAVFNFAEAAAGVQRLAITDEQLSIGALLVLLALYTANLVFILITDRDVFW